MHIPCPSRCWHVRSRNRQCRHVSVGDARTLSFKDWWLPQWEPGHFTLLFFHDEAVSLAAGHRPCALCRRGDYNAYRTAISEFDGSTPLPAKDLDHVLHGQRIHRGSHRRRFHELRWPDVPAGTFVVQDDGPVLVLGARLVPWTTNGYGEAHPRPRAGTATVITPPTSVDALRGGYRPQIDESARD